MKGSGDPAVAAQQFYPAFHMAQNKGLGAVAAKPEVLDRFIGHGKAVKPSSIQTHEQLGAIRVGTL